MKSAEELRVDSVSMMASHMTEYRSFKLVRAGAIVEVLKETEQLLVLGDDGGKWKTAVHSGLFARFVPSVGDYYVIYADGYPSCSPKAAFEEGYVKTKDENPPADRPKIPPGSSFIESTGRCLYQDMSGVLWHFNIKEGTYRPAHAWQPPKHLMKGPMRGIGWAVKQMFNGSSVRRKGWDHTIFLNKDRNEILSIVAGPGPYFINSADILATDWELAQRVDPPQSMG